MDALSMLLFQYVTGGGTSSTSHRAGLAMGAGEPFERYHS